MPKSQREQQLGLRGPGAYAPHRPSQLLLPVEEQPFRPLDLEHARRSTLFLVRPVPSLLGLQVEGPFLGTVEKVVYCPFILFPDLHRPQGARVYAANLGLLMIQRRLNTTTRSCTWTRREDRYSTAVATPNWRSHYPLFATLRPLLVHHAGGLFFSDRRWRRWCSRLRRSLASLERALRRHGRGLPRLRRRRAPPSRDSKRS
jgi:hypothetical protein